jgi:hypothetical protein
LGQPITFAGLTVLATMSENEVVTTLPEAVRFVTALDSREEALQEKRDERIQDHWLGLLKVQLQSYYSKPSNPPWKIWTGEDISLLGHRQTGGRRDCWVRIESHLLMCARTRDRRYLD